MNIKRTIGLCVLALLVGILTLQAGPDESEKDQEQLSDVERLVKQLGSKVYRKRVEAERKLLQMDEVATIPALRKAVTTPPDVEVQRRATRILQEVTRRREERQDRGRLAWGVDAFVEAMILNRKERHDGWWRSAVQLAEDMATRASAKKGGPRFQLPSSNFLLAPLNNEERLETQGELQNHRVVSSSVWFNQSVVESIIVSKGQITTTGCICKCVLFANDRLVFKGPKAIVADSIIFCDGDIIADADAAAFGVLDGSVIVTTGVLKPQIGGWSYENNCLIVERVRNPSPLLKLFDPALVGIEVREVDGGVRVEKVADGQPFARAGVRLADIIVDVGGRGVRSTEDFRKLVRPTAVAGGLLVLGVRREGAVLNIPVRLGKAPFWQALKFSSQGVVERG